MNISLDSLKRAVSIKVQIAALESRLEKILRGGGGDAPFPFITTQSTPLVKKGKRTMSAAHREKLRAMMNARWAAKKK